MNIFFTIFGFFLGSVLGSFIKVLADRSLSKKTFWGRSVCLNCKHILAWYDLVPLLSFLQIKGKCRYCHKKIGIEYPLVELVVGILIGFLFYQSFSGLQFTVYSLQSIFSLIIFLFDLIIKVFFIIILSAVFITDFKKMLIPDRIILPSIVIGVLINLFAVIYKIGFLYYFLNQTVIGRLLLPPHSPYFQRHVFMILEPFLYSVVIAVLISGFFMSLIIITKGKGMGGGDVKLGAFMGLMLGFPQALVALMFAFLTGAIFSVVLIVLGKKHFGQSIPFGPFLVFGSLIALFFGGPILNWYLRLSFQ